MNRAAFLILICSLIHLSHVSQFTNLHISNIFQGVQNFFLHCLQYVYGEKKIAVVTEDDIKAFRAQTYVESINELKDLDANLPDVLDIFDKIRELEKSGSELLMSVPDNGATCSVQVKFYINAIIDRAKEQCDFCVQLNVSKETPSVMNVSRLK